MHLMYFTEQPMSAYPAKEADRLGYSILIFPNHYFDPKEGSRLYNERLQEYILAEEVGFDGIMLNEHHNGPFCMQAKVNIFASLLAGMTKRVKIVLLGNPLPISENPIRLAEELAMIDMISKGRLVSGFVRGGGTESLATNTNPAFNRERFEEAHDLIVKIWTTPGPWRWEGTHYQFRVVNPWAVPMQKPHPRVWIPGVTSRETVIFAAKHRYPYIALNLPIEEAKKVWRLYDDTAAEVGYTAGPENRGYLIRCHVAETEEKAIRNAREFMWMNGQFVGVGNPIWAAPSGFLAPQTRRGLAEVRNGYRPGFDAQPPFEKQLETLSLVAGTPDQCVAKLKYLIEHTRPSILALWGSDGGISHEDTKTCIRLLGQEVLPRIREFGKELGLNSPFDINAPVSTQFGPQEDVEPAAQAASA